MNRWNGIGNLTKDPELRTTPQGVSVCSFTIAVNSGFGDKKDVDYIQIVTWRALADNCAKFLAKGRKVGVSGRISVRSYDANNGEKRYVTEIVADDVTFLSPKNESKSEQEKMSDYNNDPDFEPLTDDQLPF